MIIYARLRQRYPAKVMNSMTPLVTRGRADEIRALNSVLHRTYTTSLKSTIPKPSLAESFASFFSDKFKMKLKLILLSYVLFDPLVTRGRADEKGKLTPLIARRREDWTGALTPLVSRGRADETGELMSLALS